MSATDSPWQAVVSAALLGTERQPFTPPTAPHRLGEVLSSLGERHPESALLSAAAILALHQQTGRLPENLPIAPEHPCEATDLPRCSPRAARFLHLMLQGEYGPVLPEWLAVAAQAGQRVPELHLPTLLDLGRQQRHLREAILLVLGQRGRWLAAQNPDWSYAVELETEADWETGSIAARSLFLQHLRTRNPDRARELLSSCWSQEAASDRVRFLESFYTGLSMADEPFLEDVLNDRSKEVRRIAADMLSRLPDSRLCQRMTERLQPLVQLKLQAGKVKDIDITLPETCDTAMQRDGIEPKPQSRIGQHAWWLQQIIAATPLHFWQHSQSSDIPALLQLANGHEWRKALVEGWLLATQRQGNKEWGQAFLHHSTDYPQDILRQLLDFLTSEQRQSLACTLIRKTGMSSSAQNIVLVLAQSREPWSEELTRSVLESLNQHGNINDYTRQWQVREQLKAAVLCIPPRFLPEATTLLANLQPASLSEVVHEFLSTLQMRQDLWQAFSQTG
jgi:hypothetical protein